MINFVYDKCIQTTLKDGLEGGRNGVRKSRNRVYSVVHVSGNRESGLNCNKKYKRSPVSVEICLS